MPVSKTVYVLRKFFHKMESYRKKQRQYAGIYHHPFVVNNRIPF